MNNTMDMVIPFMTRLIDNEERKSYANSMTVNENSNQAINTSEKKSGGFKIPFLNGG